MTNFYRLADPRARRRIVSFDRRELSRLLNLYSLRVASGEWRDYAIDFRPGMAIFSIFRHTAEQPLFAIAGASNGHPASAPMARPAPAPMPPPVTARSPQVSPQPARASASGSRIRALTLLVFMTRPRKGGKRLVVPSNYCSQLVKALSPEDGPIELQCQETMVIT